MHASSMYLHRFEHTHVPPASKCATPASHTHRANCLVFTRRLPPLRSVNRVQSIRVISCAEWTSCLTGCGLRGSWAQETRWAEAETSTPPQPSPSCQEISTCLLNTELYVIVSCTPRRLSAIRKYLDVSSR